MNEEQNKIRQEFNREATELGERAIAEIKAEMAMMNIGQRGDLLKSVSLKNIYSKSGFIRKQTISFERHGIFVAYGVGRGYPINGPSANATAIRKTSGRTRLPKPWNKTPHENLVERLAEALTKMNAAMITETIIVETGLKKQ